MRPVSFKREILCPSFLLFHLKDALQIKDVGVADSREQDQSHGASFPRFCLHHHLLIQRSGWWTYKTWQTSSTTQRTQEAPLPSIFLPPATFVKAQAILWVQSRTYLTVSYCVDSSPGHVYLFMLKDFIHQECMNDCSAIQPRPIHLSLDLSLDLKCKMTTT